MTRPTAWSRYVGYVTGPFDCLDPKGQPSHSKTMATLAFVHFLPLVPLLILAVLLGWLPVSTLAFTLGFATLLAGMPYGLSGYKAAVYSRLGGTADALGEALRALPPGVRPPGPDDGEEASYDAPGGSDAA